MAQIVKLRRSAVTGNKPTTSQLELGELAMNTYDGKIYFEKSGSAGESIEEILITNAQNTGSLSISGSSHNITGALELSGSLKLPTTVRDYTNSTGSVGQILQVTENGAVWVDNTATSTGDGRTAKQTFSALTTWTFVHNLNEQYPVIELYDNNNQVIIPSTITATNSNTLTITFAVPVAGTAVATVGGMRGYQGFQGFQGADGYIGADGAQGAQGDRGYQGYQGFQGDQGYQGAQGDQGSTGAQGTKGDQGFQGTQGPQGDQGATGAQGAVSSSARNVNLFTATAGQTTFTIPGGYTVNLVDVFWNGVKQTVGVDYTASNGTTVILTNAAAAGDTIEIDNYLGEIGSQGVQGATGAQGATGPQGSIGAQGATGSQGAAGAQGDVGAQGATGLQGTTGAQGANGAQGFQGSTGAQGTAGSLDAVARTGDTMTGALNIGNFDGQALKLQSGTPTGTSYLRFYNSTGGAEGYLGLFNNGTNYYLLDASSRDLYLNGASNIYLQTAGTSRLTVTSTGIGINTNSPSSLPSGGGGIFSIYQSSAASLWLGGNTLSLDGQGTNRDLYFYFRYSSSAIFQTDSYYRFLINSTEVIRITAAGYLGIGTTSPQHLLHAASAGISRLTIQNTNNQSTGAGIQMLVTNNGTTVGNGTIRTDNSDNMQFFNSSAETLRISGSTGYVNFYPTDPTTNRTSLNDVLTITQTSGNAPYSGWGSGILFRGTTYSGSGSNNTPGTKTWGRIGMFLNDSYDNFAGESMSFSVAPDDRSDNLINALTLKYNGSIGTGTLNPLGSINNLGLHINRGGHSTLLIGDGFNDGGVLQSSDNIPRLFIGANIYDDSINSWQQFTSSKGYAAFDAIASGTEAGLARILTGNGNDSGYASTNIAFEAYRDNSTAYVKLRVYDIDAQYINTNGYTGFGNTNPQHRIHTNGNIYSTDTVFARNLKPEAFAGPVAGSPTGATIPLGYSSINISTPCDNSWRSIMSNINDFKGYFWVTLGDAASKDTAHYFMAMTSPAYGVSSFGVVSYQDNGWNTGGFEFTYDNLGSGTHRLLVRCTSYYNSGNTAYGTIYFLRLE
jgi:hypothetical protein